MQVCVSDPEEDLAYDETSKESLQYWVRLAYSVGSCAAKRRTELRWYSCREGEERGGVKGHSCR